MNILLYLSWCRYKLKLTRGYYRRMTASQRGVLLMKQMYIVINKYFPKLFELMALLPDNRKDPTYDMSEIITGCIAMFILKEASRNAFNSDRDEVLFRDNYKKIFKKQLPHMDTVHRVISQLTPENLEGIKTAFVATLIEQRLFRCFKLFGKYYTVAVDGTGVNSYKENNTEQNRIHKTSKSGVVTYYSYVVEAKLVTSSGFCISLKMSVRGSAGGSWGLTRYSRSGFG